MKSIWVILACVVCETYAANILVMIPSPAYSHMVNFRPVFKDLARRGHNMTVVSPFPLKKPIPNWTDIPVRNIMKDLMASFGKEPDLSEAAGLFFDLFGLWLMPPLLFELMAKEEPVQKIITDTTSSFDLVIIQANFGSEPFYALGQKFNAPIVGLHSAGVNPTLMYLTGNHHPSSYLPSYHLQVTDRMGFFDRVKTTFFYIWETYGTLVYYFPKMDSLMRKYILYEGANLPPLMEMLRNTSLILMDSHLGLHYPRPLHNNLVEVGGSSINDGDKLPEDLDKFMNESTNGVIFFTMGSNFKMDMLKPQIRSALMSAFGKVKQNVLLKYEADVLPGKPPNVRTGKWLPQASVLGHPNCKLFITHGGLHGVMEGLFHGVPMVGIPLYGDQPFNIKFLENVGTGVKVDLKTLTEESLLNAINTILTNKTYKANAMKRKAIMRDNPIPIVDKAAYWVEYVLRHKGAPHLRPASLDLHWFQYYLLDVILFLAACSLAIVFISGFIFVKTFKLVLCCFCGSKKKKPKRD